MLMATKCLRTLALYKRGAGTEIPSKALVPLKFTPLSVLMLRSYKLLDLEHLVEIIDACRGTLTDVNLSLAKINNTVIDRLSLCKNLVRLQLRTTEEISGLSNNTLQQLVTNCRKLVSVDLSGLPITDGILKDLLCDKPNFHTLEIETCSSLTYKCIETLTEAKSLRVLSVSGLKFVDTENVTNLAKSLQKLLFLKVSGCNLPFAEIKKAKEQPVAGGSMVDRETTGLGQWMRELNELLPNTFIVFHG
eukprot:TRINITY_DN7054_c0_g1_i3.p1 TRINITY_DN7054_c0_g1~~TRINITY_DN7054_c0_g1_i3.p1  ORF type:complete len:248 (+),score=62.82 TRINITY_DN7054_c0_g1_i3:282-1025(+)